jgi:hypothetical protein
MLQLNLMHNTQANKDSAMTFVREHVHPDATVTSMQAKTLHVQLPRDLELRNVFSVLYSPESATHGGINQFLLSQSSLEDVFVALGE